ncbi:SGNH/GDSL hydrolase family protein [Gordonia soli]|uniref:Putative esterase n=1 Tax=Gordonia soli NBRC 108243 TaxID=1223545 RepID=M0QKJ0_9ACTN|nr:SGNH/GDSL hydrolase family protein [Gordonia soli]GAC69160.1 putative esterase [Gordonia soli NBRC 108243]
MRIRPRLLVGALALTVVASALTAPGAEAAPLRYAALGASYSAGVGIPPSAPGSPAGCGRSTKNFPRLVAAAKGYSLTDVSCGGARTENLTTSQLAGQPPQYNALSADTDIVTLTIGYNDGNVYSGGIADCRSSSSTGSLGSLGSSGSLGSGSLGGSQAIPCEVVAGPRYSAAIQTTGLAIARALDGIKSRAPSARILVVGYPAIYPSSGNCPTRNPFSRENTAFLDRLERQLNSMLATQARAAGATFVDTYARTVGHDSCKLPGIRWVEPYSNPIGALRLHPNAAGHRAMARAVSAAIG